MNIILLAAGSSRRMGKINKLLININGKALVCHSALNALDYLQSLEEPSNLIIVTGYRNQSTLKALRPCIDLLEKTKAPIKLIIVKNPNYKAGQFSSVKTGVAQLQNEDFFIMLADLPKIQKEHYLAIQEQFTDCDVVRPSFNGQPGHPVLLSSKLITPILNAEDSDKVSNIICKFKVKNHKIPDDAIVKDIDTPLALSTL